NIIVLPSNRTKNSRTHVVPLAPMARAILEARPRRGGRDFVFGAGERGFAGFSRAKTRLDADSKVAPFVIHDIRRSTATHMAKIELRPYIVEAVLNHVSGHKSGVAGIYNRALYESEKATALSRWAQYIADLVEGRKSKVAPLRSVS